jgi:FMN phosphatase YigB (HAD superfamily)
VSIDPDGGASAAACQRLMSTDAPSLPFDPELIVFDLDDTQTRCRVYYQWAKARFTRAVTEVIPGLERAQVLARYHEIDTAAMRGPLGFGLARMPWSMVATYEACCAEAGLQPDPAVGARCRGLGERILVAPYSEIPGTRAMLGALRAAGYRLACCTKGEDAMQHAKLARNGLTPYFERVDVVRSKGPSTLASLAAAVGVDSNRVLMVGDSLADDIGPAKTLGWATAWVTETYDPMFAVEHGAGHITPAVTLLRVAELGAVTPIAARLAAVARLEARRGRGRLRQ